MKTYSCGEKVKYEKHTNKGGFIMGTDAEIQ